MQNTLNLDQQLVADRLLVWWTSGSDNIIITGSGGVGKTYLINTVLKRLPKVKPVLLAPTHEALEQLVDKVEGDYISKTVHSALGIVPSDREEELVFEQLHLPAFWKTVNLAVIDEAGMVDEPQINLLLKLGIKIIWLGHKAQLPPVKTNRRRDDPCISPIFNTDFEIHRLTIPQRNTGDLWNFCELLEKLTEVPNNYPVPTTFDVSTKKLNDYFASPQGRQDIFEGRTKIIFWRNQSVDNFNDRFRFSYFGEKAKHNKYLPGDKVIFVKPYTQITRLEKYTQISLCKMMKEREELLSLFSNTKAEVVSCETCTVKLNASLVIPCYNLRLRLKDGTEIQTYEPVYSQSHEIISAYFKQRLWSADRANKVRFAKERFFVMSCFAHLKHYYATTAHRVQGATIPKVIVMDNDISQNPNIIEMKKCRYTAVSRARDEVMFYRLNSYIV